ncbi:MAG: cytochrome b/b6 domain-containing protein [Methylotenera sp.]|nr:cytochrome b/b6 domain-containing protein [Methylotenera sp.]
MEKITYRRQKVYDPALRLIHLWNGLAILFLMVTIWISDLFDKGVGEDTLWQIHIFIGYALVVGIVARLAWGLVGPRHARYSDLWHPAAWWNAVRHFNLTTKPRFGHNTLASAVYLLVYLLLIAMAVSGLGLAAIEHSMGPFNAWFGDMTWLKDLFEEPHEIIYYLLMGFVVIHIAALIWHEYKDKTPVAQAMVTGYQYEVEPNSVQQTQGDDHA